MGQIRCEALELGYINGKGRIQPGQIFTIPDYMKPGKWMRVLEGEYKPRPNPKRAVHRKGAVVDPALNPAHPRVKLNKDGGAGDNPGDHALHPKKVLGSKKAKDEGSGGESAEQPLSDE